MYDVNKSVHIFVELGDIFNNNFKAKRGKNSQSFHYTFFLWDSNILDILVLSYLTETFRQYTCNTRLSF